MFCSLLAQILTAPLAPAPYEVCYDLQMSPYAGGEDLLTATRVIETGVRYFESDSRTVLARLGRLSELLLLYLPLNAFADTVQHEVFGHGYRIRDINRGIVKVQGYHFDFPPPYGSGNGETSFSLSPSRITTTDLTSISMAGIEGALILAQLTKMKWLAARTIDPRQTVLYLMGQYNLNLYASQSELEADSIDAHDLCSYVESLNLTYTEDHLSVSTLKKLAWINMADPFTYYSLFAWFHYLLSGKEGPIPMIPIKDYGYLFGAHLGMTPFGPEIFSDHYLLKGKDPIYFYLKGGNHAKNTYLGIGAFIPRLFRWDAGSLGLRFDLWRQPQLLLHQGRLPLYAVDFLDPPDPPLYSRQAQKKQRVGVAASLIGAYQPHPAFGLQAEVGFKTKGFLPGNSLYQAPILRVSYLLEF